MGKVCPCDAQHNSCQVNATLDPQKGSGKSSLINTVFKVNIQVCSPSYFVFLTCQPNYIPKTRQHREDQTLITRFNQKIIVILSFTRALDLDPAMARTCRPSEISSHIGLIPVVQLLRDYMPSGRESKISLSRPCFAKAFDLGFVFQHPTPSAEAWEKELTRFWA